jgi:hypothetical protein
LCFENCRAITEEIRVLIRRMAQENSDWGAPKIHGELLKLGLAVSELATKPATRPANTGIR